MKRTLSIIMVFILAGVAFAGLSDEPVNTRTIPAKQSVDWSHSFTLNEGEHLIIAKRNDLNVILDFVILPNAEGVPVGKVARGIIGINASVENQ